MLLRCGEHANWSLLWSPLKVLNVWIQCVHPQYPVTKLTSICSQWITLNKKNYCSHHMYHKTFHDFQAWRRPAGCSALRPLPTKVLQVLEEQRDHMTELQSSRSPSCPSVTGELWTQPGQINPKCRATNHCTLHTINHRSVGGNVSLLPHQCFIVPDVHVQYKVWVYGEAYEVLVGVKISIYSWICHLNMLLQQKSLPLYNKITHYKIHWTWREIIQSKSLLARLRETIPMMNWAGTVRPIPFNWGRWWGNSPVVDRKWAINLRRHWCIAYDTL